MRTLLTALTALMLFATPVGASIDHHNVAFTDDLKIFRNYRKAAEWGDAHAQFSLGVMYAKGKGVPGDDAKAVHWWRQAAEQGHAKAQFNLGVMYDDGEGVPEDDAKAARWWRKAAEQGVARAQTVLGISYCLGDGLPIDKLEAYAWLSIATTQGNAHAKRAKAIIETVMTPAQIAEAQKLSSEYWEKYVVPFQKD